MTATLSIKESAQRANAVLDKARAFADDLEDNAMKVDLVEATDDLNKHITEFEGEWLNDSDILETNPKVVRALKALDASFNPSAIWVTAFEDKFAKLEAANRQSVKDSEQQSQSSSLSASVEIGSAKGGGEASNNDDEDEDAPDNNAEEAELPHVIPPTEVQVDDDESVVSAITDYVQQTQIADMRTEVIQESTRILRQSINLYKSRNYMYEKLDEAEDRWAQVET